MKTDKARRRFFSEEFEKLSVIPSVVSGRIIDPIQKLVRVNFSQGQVHHDSRTNFQKTYIGSRIIGNQVDISSSEKYGVRGRDSEFSLSFSSSEEKAGTKKWTANIWNQTSGIIKQIALPTSTLHGDVVTCSPFFGGVSWNSDQSKFLYLAEYKPKKTKHYWEKSDDDDDESKKKQKKEEDNEEVEGEGDEEKEKDIYNEKFIYEDTLSYGEQLSKVKQPRIFEYDWKEGSVKSIENIPSFLSCATPFYNPMREKNEETVCFVGYDIRNFKLGLAFCFQRPNQFFEVPSPSHHPHQQQHSEKKKKIITFDDDKKEIWNVLFPRISPDGKTLVFLTTTKVAYHFPCFQLRKIDLSEPHKNNRNICDRNSTILVDIVSHPEDNNSFPGLYPRSLLTEYCWSTDSKYVFIESIWRSDAVILRIDVQKISSKGRRKSRIERIRHLGDHRSSMFFLDQFDNYLLIAQSCPNNPYIIRMIKIKDDDQVDKVDDISKQRDDIPFLDVEEEYVVEESRKTLPMTITEQYLDQVTFDVRVIHQTVSEQVYPFEIIIMKPIIGKDEEGKKKTGKKLGMMMFPHGGPHSISYTRFLSSCLYLTCSLGMIIVQVNYRGSIGFGQLSIEQLARNVGEWDLEDVKRAREYMIEEFPDEIDVERIGVMGGSHGGFISLGSIGKFPGLYKVAVTRNPVTDVCSMTCSTDIPDWCFTESSVDYTLSQGGLGLVPTSEYMRNSFEKSPLKMVRNVTAPALILIGEDDLRVPTSQGMFYYRCLKRLGKVAKMKVYPGNNHGLSKSEANADVWIGTAIWIHKYLKM